MRQPRSFIPSAGSHISAGATDEAVYARIKQAILESRLPPGTKLGEEKLSSIFEVSRERIRKILLRLHYDKCVELKPNRGAYVAKPTTEEAHEVFEARLIVEPQVAELAALNAGEDDLALLEANIKTEKAAHTESHLNEAIAVSGEFHLLLARASGNAVLAEIVHDLVARSSLIIATYGWRSYSLCAYEDHELFLLELKRRDGRGASDRMRGHLESVENQLRLEAYPINYVDLDTVFGVGG